VLYKGPFGAVLGIVWGAIRTVKRRN